MAAAHEQLPPGASISAGAGMASEPGGWVAETVGPEGPAQRTVYRHAGLNITTWRNPREPFARAPALRDPGAPPPLKMPKKKMPKGYKPPPQFFSGGGRSSSYPIWDRPLLDVDTLLQKDREMKAKAARELAAEAAAGVEEKPAPAPKAASAPAIAEPPQRPHSAGVGRRQSYWAAGTYWGEQSPERRAVQRARKLSSLPRAKPPAQRVLYPSLEGSQEEDSGAPQEWCRSSFSELGLDGDTLSFG